MSFSNPDRQLPSYSIDGIIKLKDKIYNELAPEYNGYAHLGPSFDKLVSHTHSLLPKYIDYDVVYRTMMSLAGAELTAPVLQDLAWRLAGNLPRLRKQTSIPIWTCQIEAEWAPMQILATRKSHIKRKDSISKGAWCQFIVLAGLAAGKKFARPVTYDYCYIVKGIFGFSRYDRERYTRAVSNQPNYVMHDIVELTKLRAYGYMTTASCKDAPNFVDLDNTQTLIKFNRSIMQMRLREGFACPANYDVEATPCYLCERGYSGDSGCFAACHPVTYVRQQCPVCNTSSFFDPSGLVTDRCVDCITAGK